MQTETDARRPEGRIVTSMVLYWINNRTFLDLNADPDRAAELARATGYPQKLTRKLRANENDIFNGTPQSSHSGCT